MTVHTPIDSGSRGIPGWALGVTVFVFVVAGVYFAGNLTGENPPITGGPIASGGDVTQRAQALINRAGCQSCHGADLAGSGPFPTLHEIESGPVSENLQEFAAANPDTWAEIWIDGTDPAVSDPAMRMGMPAFGDQLTDEEISIIVEYLKTLP